MLQIREIHKEYKTGTLVQKALDGVSLSFRENEFVAVLGPSGSGKTTLLNVIGGLDHADRGELVIDGVPTQKYKSRDWDAYRNHSVGFIFQSYNLIPHQTLQRNVELAMTLAGVRRDERRARAAEALEKVGLREQMHKKPDQLSGGQMQRVAIARALVNRPSIVLADEPTGALDSETGEQVMKLLSEVAKDHLVIMVTHNPDLAERYATRIIRLHDGRVTEDSDPYDPDGEKAPAANTGAAAAENAAGSLPEAAEKTAAVTGDTAEEIPAAAAENAAAPARNTGAETPAVTAENMAEPARDTAEEPAPGKQRKPSMSILTALSLSVSNLMSKKARTILVAFAASIGITGIALILSLSSGANAYIHDMEEEALSQYPLELMSSTFSMEETMMAFSQMGSDDSARTQSGQVEERQVLGSMLSGSSTNDLASLKRWFGTGESGIEDCTRSVDYRYGISPQVFLEEKGTWRQVNPDQTMSAMGVSMDESLTSIMSSWGGNDAFLPLPENPDIYKNAYHVLAGRWPRDTSELVLVLMSGGRVPDYLLYTMGLKDADHLNEVISDLKSGTAADTGLEEAGVYDPEAFLGISYRVVPACDLYDYDETLGVWLDISGDAAAAGERIAKGHELTIVGVVEPEDSDSVGLLQFGIDYLPSLTDQLMKESARSRIVRDQLADPDRDVLTGAVFGEDDPETDFASVAEMFSFDPEKLPDAVSIDREALGNTDWDDYRISARETVKIIRELSREGESPTLTEVLKTDILPLLKSVISIDQEKMAEVISMEMDESRMQEMFAARAAASAASYRGNLLRFGYADPAEPTVITIYPTDFEGKDEVIRILDAYNRAMEEAGKDDKVISYTDYVGTLMESVTTIIDVITYVLIAFVAVSLVVSSIMIGIITYISVLERRKEIGILRAMGASRRNISQVFNAETFIIGLLAGTFGIVLTLLLLIPLNSAIHTVTDQANVRAFLPPGSGLVLIALCIVLNLIGGIIPAAKAARQDPVAALRSE